MRPGRSTILPLALIGVSPPATAAAQQPAQAGRAAPPVRAAPPPYAPGWQDGHVDVAAGDRLTLTVTRLPTGRGPRRDNYAANSAPPFPQFPRGAVIATIGGPPFLVESSRSIVASAPGHLRLAVNFGTAETASPIPAFTVSVRLTPGKRAVTPPTPTPPTPTPPTPTPPTPTPPTPTPPTPPPPTPPPPTPTPPPAPPTPTSPPAPPAPTQPIPPALPKPSTPTPPPKPPPPTPPAPKLTVHGGLPIGSPAGDAGASPGPAAILALAVLLALLAGAGLETGRRIRARRQIRKPPLLAFSPRLERGEGGVTGDEIATTGPEVRLRAMLEPGETFFDGSEPEVRNG